VLEECRRGACHFTKMKLCNIVVDECAKNRKEYLNSASVGYAPNLEEH
jgi:hypothetical protein